MAYLINEFGCIPLELIVPFPTDIPFQSKLQNSFHSIASSALMMQNKTEHMKELNDDNITSLRGYSIENGDKNKISPNQSYSSFSLQG